MNRAPHAHARCVRAGRKEVRVITGRGAHSKGEPKLLGAVREWLGKQGVSFVEHVGYFTVWLDPVAPVAGTQAD